MKEEFHSIYGIINEDEIPLITREHFIPKIYKVLCVYLLVIIIIIIIYDKHIKSKPKKNKYKMFKHNEELLEQNKIYKSFLIDKIIYDSSQAVSFKIEHYIYTEYGKMINMVILNPEEFYDINENKFIIEFVEPIHIYKFTIIVYKPEKYIPYYITLISPNKKEVFKNSGILCDSINEIRFFEYNTIKKNSQVIDENFTNKDKKIVLHNNNIAIEIDKNKGDIMKLF